jgi:hypothetical protein
MIVKDKGVGEVVNPMVSGREGMNIWCKVYVSVADAIRRLWHLTRRQSALKRVKSVRATRITVAKQTH